MDKEFLAEGTLKQTVLRECPLEKPIHVPRVLRVVVDGVASRLESLPVTSDHIAHLRVQEAVGQRHGKALRGTFSIEFVKFFFSFQKRAQQLSCRFISLKAGAT
jgi:hypothetical protein